MFNAILKIQLNGSLKRDSLTDMGKKRCSAFRRSRHHHQKYTVQLETFEQSNQANETVQTLNMYALDVFDLNAFSTCTHSLLFARNEFLRTRRHLFLPDAYRCLFCYLFSFSFNGKQPLSRLVCQCSSDCRLSSCESIVNAIKTTKTSIYD